ncbi:hypothetical protein HU200_024167 [Digitaria exilis]|uniref:NADH dehydrogenase [ubiquinone] 1 alpha subcomplex subunit 1 n=1 Tax=Digitaria exilis TaxID=1010633 RepID=A0A835EVW1_9POAL|nr:hypothetical protein HU200_024167 [Digitaria exilis]
MRPQYSGAGPTGFRGHVSLSRLAAARLHRPFSFGDGDRDAAALIAQAANRAHRGKVTISLSVRPLAHAATSLPLGRSRSRRRRRPPSAAASPFRLPRMARLQWLEAMLPLGIIGGMLCIMGNAQYFIHKAAHGRVRPRSSPISTLSRSESNTVLTQSISFLSRPKHIGNDMWDVAMERRDKKLIEQSSGN